MPGGILGSGSRAIHGSKFDNKRMAWLADPCPPAHDSLNPCRRPFLAAICSSFRCEPVFPSSLAHLGYRSRHSHRVGAMAARRHLARRFAGRQRRSHNFGARLHHRLAGELVHLPLPAGHHRDQHFVFAPRGVCHHRNLSGYPRRDGGSCFCWKDPSLLCS
jgi:hypothetical protein